jgi:integrase
VELDERDALPYAIAFYAGLRRSEIHRLEWPEVLADDDIASRLLVIRSKSEAGRERRPPIVEPLRIILAAAWNRPGRPRRVPVCDRSVMSGKLQRGRPQPGSKRGFSASRSTSVGTPTPRC